MKKGLGKPNNRDTKMIIRCVRKDLSTITNAETINRINRYVRYPKGRIESLNVAENYSVYGLLFRNNCLWYLICDSTDDSYPLPVPAEYFEVIDQSLPSYWVVNHRQNELQKREFSNFLISFDKFVNDPTFFSRLIDGDPIAEKQFKDYKRLV